MRFSPAPYPSSGASVSVDEVLWSTLSVTVLVAIFALALLEFLRPSLRRFLQAAVIRRWLRIEPGFRIRPENVPPWFHRNALPDHVGLSDERESAEKRAVWAKVLWGSWLTNDLFMRRVQAIAQQVTEGPARAIDDFVYLASYADRADIVAVLAVDRTARDDPHMVAQIFGGIDSPHHPEATNLLGAAQQAVARSAERKLDELQLQLTSVWSLTSRLAFLVAGLAVAFIAASGFSRDRADYILAIGLLGGLGASWLQSLIGTITGRQPD